MLTTQIIGFLERGATGAAVSWRRRQIVFALVFHRFASIFASLQFLRTGYRGARRISMRGKACLLGFGVWLTIAVSALPAAAQDTPVDPAPKAPATSAG